MNTHPTIHIAIADDHLMIAEALRDSLNNMDGLNVMLIAANGKELMDMIAKATSPMCA